jgi:capsid protein
MAKEISMFEAIPKLIGNLTRRTPKPKNEVDVFATPNAGVRTRGSDFTIRDVREASPSSRLDMVKNSRLLRAKLGLVRGVYENSSRFALGPAGIQPTSISGNLEWSLRADDRFLEVASRPEFDVREEQSFFQMQQLLLPEVMCDGDVGGARVRGADQTPQIQLFNTEAISNGGTFGPSRAEKTAGAQWKEGILRSDKGGRPLKYRIQHERKQGQTGSPIFTDFDKADFLHIGRFDRINQNRPMPWLHHGDESALDILDLTALEKQAARLNSFFAACIKTQNGQLPGGIEDILSTETDTISTEDSDGATTTKETTRTYANLFGGAGIPVLSIGEEMQFFKNERPSTTFAGFIDWLVNDIALGFGVPPQFVWALSGLSGPNARLVLQQADWFFAYLREMLITRFCRPVWEGIISDSMNRGLLPAPPAGTNWKKVTWQGPASMTIDKGRDGKLFEALVKAGLMTRSEWHEMSGKAGRTQRTRIIDELAEDIAYCQERGVPLELYFGLNPAELTADGSTDPEEIAQSIITLQEENAA